jgi:hypothetical protein
MVRVPPLWFADKTTRLGPLRAHGLAPARRAFSCPRALAFRPWTKCDSARHSVNTIALYYQAAQGAHSKQECSAPRTNASRSTQLAQRSDVAAAPTPAPVISYQSDDSCTQPHGGIPNLDADDLNNKYMQQQQ